MTKKYSNRITARARSRGRIRHTRYLTEAGINALNASDASTAIINSFLGIHTRCVRLLASDLRALYKAAVFFERWFLKDRRRHPNRRYFFLTISDSDFLTDDTSPIVSIEVFKRKINNTMRNMKNLSALVHFEMQAVCQYEAGARIIIPHAHGIAWTDNPEFDPRATMAALNKAGHWHSALGGRPIDILEIPNTEEDTRRTAHYVSKPIDSAKNRRRRKNGKPYQTDTRKGYRSDLALRMAEGLSLIPVEDTYLGIRGGSPARRDLMIHLRRWHTQRPQPAITPADFDVWDFWRTLRLKHGSPRLLPWRVDTQRPLCLPAGLYTLKAPKDDGAPADNAEFAQPEAAALKVRDFSDVADVLDNGVTAQTDGGEPEGEEEEHDEESVAQPRRRRRRRDTSNASAKAEVKATTEDADEVEDEEPAEQSRRRRRRSQDGTRTAPAQTGAEADEGEEELTERSRRRRRRRRKSQQSTRTVPAQTEAESDDENEEEELTGRSRRRRRRRKFRESECDTQPEAKAKTDAEEDDDPEEAVNEPRRRRRKPRKDTRGTPLEIKRSKGGRGNSTRRSSGQRRR